MLYNLTASSSANFDHEDGGSVFLCNADIQLQGYTVLQPTKPELNLIMKLSDLLFDTL
jgi:hypothetical protein